MQYFADLHIHSKYAMATSRDCDAPHLDVWARKKGIRLVGTGDFTHPGWRAELRETLIPAEEGLYQLKPELRLPAPSPCGEEPTRFVVSGEISSIYKKGGKTRKVHNVILLPGLAAADALSLRLERIGNIRADGRPILGLDSRDLLELTLETCPEAIFLPAHIWTPHFSLFGAFSGFDAIEECFSDLTGHIHALETGLSSDPPMNWQVSALDRFTLVSNSDAHSPQKLGREANLLDAPLSYTGLRRALETGEGFLGTVEFFPEEGKYHLDGHRSCGVCLSPAETARLGGRCPVCGKKLTIGVQHRAWELADRAEGFTPPGAKPFQSLAPLPEVLAAALGLSASSRAALRLYEKLLSEIGPEFFLLREAEPAALERVAGPLVAEAIRRMRAGRVRRIPGYDGEFGRIELFDPAEREKLLGQTALFGLPAGRPGAKAPQAQAERPPKKKKEKPQPRPGQKLEGLASLNEGQRLAVMSEAPAIAVIAGPGTGKTGTLVARIAYLIEERGVSPEEITAVTFTNQAAAEMRARLGARLGDGISLDGMTIGTFHAVCLGLLGKKTLLGQSEQLALLRELLRAAGSDADPKKTLRAISEKKCGGSAREPVDEGLYAAYCARLAALGARDLDDLLLDALALSDAPPRRFSHLLVDEFQDVNAVQRRLIRKWSAGGKGLFVIGDPDQSIYGFRGASADCFAELERDLPALVTITLGENYRSSPEILAAAGALIGHNPGGRWPLKAVRGPGAQVRLVGAESAFAEAVFIAAEIGRMAGGVDMISAGKAQAADGARAFSEIAVLARTRRQLELIESCLLHNDIPCVVSGREDALESDAVQGALAFFRFVREPGDAAALQTALVQGFGCGRMEAEAAQSAVRAGLAQGARPDAALLLAAGCPKVFAAAWAEYAELMGRESPQRLIERFAAAQGAQAALSRLADMAVFFREMGAFLDALTLGEEADLLRAAGKGYASGAVRLMTLHGAKGLEFPVVFCAGLSEGSLPLVRQDGPADVEEERRLLFVGMTRAREELILTGFAPDSPFLSELPGALLAGRERAKRPAPQVRQMSLF